MNYLVVYATSDIAAQTDLITVPFAEQHEAHEWLDDHAERAVLIDLSTGEVEDYT